MADLLNIVWGQQPNGDGWDVPPYPVIWISVAALEAEWRKTGDYISAGGVGSKHGGRYEHFGEFFSNAEFVFMPTVCLDDERRVSFTDGRHRFAWLRDRGLRSLPIAVPPDQAASFEARFGTSDRVGAIL
ncbi:hypothetical protein [Cupriavidus sp. CuC1]|uniref:hypothetical protein n=1 Tax=Cupriavidus sp. CuC1 TaxID=3373131 RepID=UPI0037D139BD